MTTHAKRHKERDGEAGEGSLCFLLTKPVTAHALDDEITTEMGWRKNAGLVIEGDAQSAAEDHPIALWVLRTDVDPNAVKRAVTAHQEVEGPTFDSAELDALRAKVAAGDPLSGEDIATAVRLLLLRG